MSEAKSMNAEHIEALRERWGLLHRLCEEYALVNEDAQVAKYRREQRALDAAIAALSAEGGAVAWQYRIVTGGEPGEWAWCSQSFHDKYNGADFHEFRELFTRPAAAAKGDGSLPELPTPAIEADCDGEQVLGPYFDTTQLQAYARAAVALSKSASAATGDMVLVPREPAPAMLSAVGTMSNYDVDAGGNADADHIAWRKDMIAAAQQEPGNG